jgi:hypothetical protein
MKNILSFNVLRFVSLVMPLFYLTSCNSFKPINSYQNQEINFNIPIDIILEKINDTLDSDKYSQLIFVITTSNKDKDESIFVKQIIENISVKHPKIEYSIVEKSILQNLNNNNIVVYFK